MRTLLEKGKILIGLVFLSAALVLAPDAHAGTEHNVSGYAWSTNAGWISFNCTNDSTCGTSNYGVHRGTDGSLSGYAWSSVVGWIQFGGLSGFPSGSGTTAADAAISGTTVSGWARTISYGGGWDGWISLRGTGPAYGVSYSAAGDFSGYAWGGDVIGWILFDVDNVYPAICTDCGVKIAADASLDVKSSGVSIVDETDVDYGTVPTFEWTLTNMPGGVTCSVSKLSSGGTAFATVSNINTSGSVTGSALTAGDYEYQISCTNGVTRSVEFTVAAQPPGFSLGSTESVAIQFLVPGSATSEERAVFVSAFGGFTDPVTVSITGFPPAIASTTFSYSFNGGSSFSSSPSTIISNPYSTGIGFEVRVTRLQGAPAFEGPYTVTLTGTAASVSPVTKELIIMPTTFVPVFEEF